MDKSTLSTSGIIGILNRTRAYNPEIGNYQEHFINENFHFVVRLSNGRITIPRTMAEDQEVQPSSVSEERIKKVANTFSKA